MADESPRSESAITYDVSPDESLAEGVVRAMSAISGADPVPDGSSSTESTPVLDPLYSVVDPEAIDDVFRPTETSADRARGRLSFSYHGCEVTVHSEGRISVERPESPAGEAAE